MAATDPGSDAGSATVVPEENTTPQDITIAEEGDIVLVLEDGKKRIKVQAAVIFTLILSFKSKVFKKMLGPHFLEGQTQRSPEQPQDIQLSDDNANAMELMCKLLHLGRPVGIKCTPRDLSRMASLADKYDCVDAVSLISEALLKRWAAPDISCTKSSGQGLARFAAVALALRLDDLFVQTTRCMVLDMSISFSAACNDELSASVLLGLEEQRQFVRNSLLNALAAHTAGKCILDRCNVTSTTSTFEKEMVRRLGLKYWPPCWEAQSLREFLEKLAVDGDVALGHTYTCGHSGSNSTRIYRCELQAVATRCNKRAYGLCAQCARQEKSQSRCEHVEKLKKVPHNDLLSWQ
ncbi:hypothetical protein LTS10_012828 [Elasticomyces elasticus]|nr:hypothetical protein LTS10_012828 [Elasticomyces elasticus]